MAKSSAAKTSAAKKSLSKIRSSKKATAKKPVFSPDVPALLAALKAAYPDPQCALTHANPFQLAVATILSAQCTDARVNMVTPALFKRFPDAAALAAADPEEVSGLIRSTGFYNNKTKSLIGFAKAVMEKFGGEVPRTMEQLNPLPGIGRKTANVILGTSFGIAAGVVVDTHVRRISGLLGLTEQTDPEKIEKELTALLPQEEWIAFSHRLILHGRAICIARRPQCEQCPLQKQCRYFHETASVAQ
ncbi:MAG TPA: endonuclease III [Planctomycetota bacterium]|nr:endonuclease III [Planctomycetota bacterium]